MANINTLLGMGLGPQDDMKALASSLRNEQAIGDYFSGSSSPRMAQYGQRLSQRTGDAAKQGGVLRQSMAKDTARQAQAAEKEKIRVAEREQDYNRGITKAKQAQTDRLSAIKAKPKGPVKFGTASERKLFEKQSSEYMQQRSALSSFKPEYGNSITIGGKEFEGYPLISQAENWLTSNMPLLTDDESKEKGKWWRDYRKFYENIERHSLFGSALTANEQAIWKASNLNENMTDEQVQSSIDTIISLSDKVMEKMAAMARAKHWPEEYIQANFEWNEQAPEAEVADDLMVAPEGINQEEWDTLTPEEKNDAIEYGVI